MVVGWDTKASRRRLLETFSNKTGNPIGGVGTKFELSFRLEAIDACVRCDNEKMVLKTFNHFFRGSKPQRRPDVISYSIIISSLLKKMYYDGSKDARKLYEEMKFRRMHLSCICCCSFDDDGCLRSGG